MSAHQTTASARARAAAVMADAARGLAMFLGGFGLINLIGERLHRGFDATIWWLDVRILPAGPGELLIAAGCVAMLAFAVRPPRRGAGRWLIAGVVAVLACIALINAATFWSLLVRDRIHAAVPVPLSLFLAMALMLISVTALRSPAPLDAPGRRGRFIGSATTLAAFVAAAIAFPLAQMFFFGKTSYARPADAIVVLGARAYADGRPSDALADRVRTACDLYHAGLAPMLIFSGGPGDGDVHETESMRRMAVSLGVPDNAITLDPAGLNTAATVANTCAMRMPGSSHQPPRFIAVSHFYHLPRVKLAYQRQGREVYTVPAREQYMLTKMPLLMAREVAAVWVYYVRPDRMMRG